MLVTLSFEQIYQRCDLAELDFADTAELNQLTRPLGQERALDAIEFGVDIKHSGFNVFALGPRCWQTRTREFDSCHSRRNRVD